MVQQIHKLKQDSKCELEMCSRLMMNDATDIKWQERSHTECDGDVYIK